MSLINHCALNQTMLSKTFVVFCILKAGLIHAAHAGFHVQYPWPSRATYVQTRPALQDYTPFCGVSLRTLIFILLAKAHRV